MINLNTLLDISLVINILPEKYQQIVWENNLERYQKHIAPLIVKNELNFKFFTLLVIGGNSERLCDYNSKQRNECHPNGYSTTATKKK